MSFEVNRATLTPERTSRTYADVSPASMSSSNVKPLNSVSSRPLSLPAFMRSSLFCCSATCLAATFRFFHAEKTASVTGVLAFTARLASSISSSMVFLLAAASLARAFIWLCST